jgi:mannosyltransferase OCH1-like enzyme
VEKHAPRLLALYRALPRNIMRADMIRYIILDVYGGLYLDLDYEMLNSFDLLDRAAVLPRESDDAAALALGNSIMASQPGHPFWQKVLRELERGIKAMRRKPIEDEVNGLTGPGLVTRAYGLEPELNAGTYIPPRAWFNPIWPKNEEEYAAMVAKGESYGIHHCDGTWTAKTYTQRLRRKAEYLWSRRRTLT